MIQPDRCIQRGVPIVVSGPSGVGKGSIITRVFTICPHLIHSVSMTTRSPRPGEEEGVHYFFVTPERFREAIEKRELAEWATVYGNSYGTLRSYLDEQFKKGLDVILDIDVQGAAAIRALYRDAALVYILPPSLDVLRQRLFSRAKGECDDLDARLQLARQEMRFAGIFDYLVVNDVLDEAVRNLDRIIRVHRMRRSRMESRLYQEGIFPACP